MTWTAARTWVDNELITAALLNQQIRDQFEAVGLHDHSAEPGAVVLTPDRVDLAQQTSAIVSTDPGRFQRTTDGVYYTDRRTARTRLIGPDRVPQATPGDARARRRRRGMPLPVAHQHTVVTVAGNQD